MIPQVTVSTASKVYSVLGNNSSLVPLAIKDIANSCGLTAASYMAGDTHEGKDRFIDEFGTQAIWLFGIPVYKKALDLAMFKPMGFDPKVDARILKNQDILKAAQEFAANDEILNSLKKVAANQSKYKYMTIAKFVASTLLTCVTYFGLTKFRHKYTENQIKKEYFEKHQQQKGKDVSFMDNSVATANIPFSSAFSAVHGKNNKNVTFTGGIQDFIFDPVKNLMLVDASITGERLSHSRNPQDFFGYVIKEGSFWAFMYLAGPMISKALEKRADAKGKSIDLDARVIESPVLKNAFADGSIKAHLEAFKAADKSDVDIYKYAVNPKTNNLLVEFAKMSDVIEVVDPKAKVQIADTRRFIDLGDLRGVASKVEKLLGQYEGSGQTIDQFIDVVRKAKRSAIRTNIGSCIGALGVLAPTIMLLTRKLSPESEYQVKKDIEAKLAHQQGIDTKGLIANA